METLTTLQPAKREIDFTRINNDVNGNPRYVLHFLALSRESDVTSEGLTRITQKYEAALKRSRTQGGRKFHNKQYGGGIVFQSYSLPALCNALNSIMTTVGGN